ncbi:GNAT family N-acetyltransferase [Austwickia sp. TVS 96-490-7B]|uniref:GNAT family N-acetyltransferase n=1 Tax=Austwickia sp. TVS 96-490-7B TaxID=2830843 RepID=UPI001C5858C2|nr:GNAT family N-acetyltransferase [Austwickia sp. TVS 96-490-7B]
MTTPDDVDQARAVIRRSMEDDQSYGYRFDWHWDVEHLREVYLDNPRNVMLIGRLGGTIVATAGIRVGGPDSPPHHPAIAARYADRHHVAQLLRVVTVPQARRRGFARQMVDAAVDWARQDGGYRVIYLHTNAAVPGAEAFWRSTGADLVQDDRGWETDTRFETLHFEFPLRPSVPATSGTLTSSARA